MGSSKIRKSVKVFDDIVAIYNRAISRHVSFVKNHMPNQNDPVFMASGAKAYLKDVPDAELHLIDAGHFAVEEKPVEIAKHIINFIEKLD